MFHWKQNRIEGLMAASLYEPLSEVEQRELDQAIGSNKDLSVEYESLKRLAGNIPNTGLAKTPDLLPLLRERLDEQVRPRWGYRLAYACAVVVVMAGASAAGSGRCYPRFPIHRSGQGLSCEIRLR